MFSDTRNQTPLHTSATRRSGGRSAGRSVSFADLSDPGDVEQMEEAEEDIQKEADEEEEAEKEADEIQGFRHRKGSRDAVFAEDNARRQGPHASESR